MALSNWDTLAVDHKKQSTNGVFVTPLGVRVEVYKNWLYVHDEAVQKNNDPYSGDVVMEVQEGKFTYRDLDIKAVRGPNDGIYALCWTGYHDDVEFMLATGIYGYHDRTGEWIGVQEENIELLRTIYRKWAREYLPNKRIEKDPFPENPLRFNQGDAFFADNLDGVTLPATTPGDTQDPLIMQSLNKKD